MNKCIYIYKYIYITMDIYINNFYDHRPNCHNPRTKNAQHKGICKLNVARNLESATGEIAEKQVRLR